MSGNSFAGPLALRFTRAGRPVWAARGLPAGATVHRVDLRHSKRGDEMMFAGAGIGHSTQPLYAAARWLIDSNAASEADTVATYRGETLCMHGRAGELAKLAVTENKNGRPTFLFHHWKAFPGDTVGSPAAETPPGVDRPANDDGGRAGGAAP
jgi:hypothetical protein